jgi:alginate O-acetyltransferase complex protein AlgI
MLFNSAAFALFFGIVFVLNAYVNLSGRQRLWLFFLSSVVFYSSWSFRFVPLLIGGTLLNFFLAGYLSKIANLSARRILVFLGVSANILLVCYFKYLEYLQGVAVWKDSLGVAEQILIPLGISFYVFQNLSYILSVYSGEIKHRTDPLPYLTGVVFFPHLLAGPIIRATNLLPQFESLPSGRSKLTDAGHACLLFTVGLAKKGIADVLKICADQLFEQPQGVSSFDAWVGSLAFTGQLYADFSGYTDMAIGLAALLGIYLPQNFQNPILSIHPADYWRRWHISLGAWIRHHLYFPLIMGSAKFKIYSPIPAILITTTLIGVWHGFGLTYLLFGIYHGILIVGTYLLLSQFPSVGRPEKWQRILQIIITIYLVIIGNIFFRAVNIDSAFYIIGLLHGVSESGADPNFGSFVVALVAILFVICHVLGAIPNLMIQKKVAPEIIWGLVGVFLALGVALSGGEDYFIYLQF